VTAGRVLTRPYCDVNIFWRKSVSQNLPQEGALVAKTFGIPDQWPELGRIQFTDFRLRYAVDLPYALDRLTFEVKANEKVGVVGRTGSGQSGSSDTDINCDLALRVCCLITYAVDNCLVVRYISLKFKFHQRDSKDALDKLYRRTRSTFLRLVPPSKYLNFIG